jgi:FAD/FMN-containing dehydrogenase
MNVTATVEQPHFNDAFHGRLVRPDDAEYDEARAIYNGSIDRRPALIVRPTGPADVVDALAYARDAGLQVSVRCGGHGIAGTSVTDGGVLIDLSSLQGIHLDPRRGTAVAEGGTLWGQYDREAELVGMATPGGRVTTTGVGGFALGGGYGWLSPVHGLTCDNLVGADVVTADGRLLHVSETENADLLWGLRGAGANFGVVTSYELRLHPIPPLLLGGQLIVPNDEIGDVARAYRTYVEQAPEQLVTALATILAPPEEGVPPQLVGTPVMVVVAMWIGDPREGEEHLQPLRDMTAGGMHAVAPMPYTALQGMLDGFAPRGWLNYHRGIHLADLPDQVLDDWLAVGRDIGSPMTQGILFRHGGAVSRVPEDATATSGRDAPYMAHPIACWASPEEGEHEMEWVRRYSEAVAPAATGGVYLNFEPGTSFADVRAGYGEEKYQRLVELKDRWDPTNVFSSNHNIAPSGAAGG